MKRSLFTLLVVGALLTAMASADDAKDEAIKKDREQIQGVWQVVSLVIDGNEAAKDDAKKLSVVNGADGTWNLRNGNMEVSQGDSTIDPTQKLKTIDFTPTKGESKGDRFFGIYELGQNSRKLCFAPAGKERPTEFSSRSGSQHILVTFEREKAK
ncbi:MAG: TIGR03067 domain-containing protein [Planctomycetota bacterium]